MKTLYQRKLASILKHLTKTLSGVSRVHLQICRIRELPAMREVYLIREQGMWRPPRVNETCCRRPALADFLQAGTSPRPRSQTLSASMLPSSAALCDSTEDVAKRSVQLLRF